MLMGRECAGQFAMISASTDVASVLVSVSVSQVSSVQLASKQNALAIVSAKCAANTANATALIGKLGSL